jgi:hypothetical protein
VNGKRFIARKTGPLAARCIASLGLSFNNKLANLSACFERVPCRQEVLLVLANPFRKLLLVPFRHEASELSERVDLIRRSIELLVLEMEMRQCMIAFRSHAKLHMIALEQHEFPGATA